MIGSSYKVSEKELLEVRNQIFIQDGIPALEKNGFVKSPFSTAWFGRDNLRDFTYELCRISDKESCQLEIITTHITRGDKWIKIFLNIFTLAPNVNYIHELMGLNGMQFHLPPNSMSKMRLRNDDYKGPPLFYMLFLPEHKLGRYNTKSEFEKEVSKLKELIKKDITNIDLFVKRWHELHQPNITDWEGNRLKY